MTLPGMTNAAAMHTLVPPGPVPMSYVFNGSDEALQRVWVTTAPPTTIFTYSLWVKPLNYSGAGDVSLFDTDDSGSLFVFCDINALGAEFGASQDLTAGAGWEELCTGITPVIGTNAWCHLLVRYDSTQATAANRLRYYKNGTLLTDDASDTPTLNQTHRLFTNGFQHLIGADELPATNTGNKRLAFIDCLAGVSADPTSFTFDNAGTLTRKPYVGSRGTYGFSLDGTNLFNDVSGNGQHFTGLNMDATNLNADVPPYVMV